MPRIPSPPPMQVASVVGDRMGLPNTPEPMPSAPLPARIAAEVLKRRKAAGIGHYGVGIPASEMEQK